jgi:hypothetical protein
MAYLMCLRRRIALAGFLLLACTAPVSAQLPQMKVDFTFKVDIQCQDPYMQNLAPWWTYFPHDPQLIAMGSRPSHYPTWPQPFPPEGSQGGAPMSRPQQMRPPGPVVQQRPFAPTAQSPPAWVRPVSYSSAQPPSYWYAR